jgi:glyoxylase-like metal-dependent hydrolase (beta-lactamase superfamily II)
MASRSCVDLYYFGRGHTNGDAFVVFPALRAMHGGDIVGGRGIPLLDANNGGSGVAIPDTLRKAADTIANVDTIIPGHGPLRTWSDLRESADFNRDFLAAIQEAKNAGKSVDEVVSSWKMPTRYANAGYAAPQPAALRRNVQIIYDELK